MRVAAVPVCRVHPSDVTWSLPPTRQLLVATEASFSMYKVPLSVEVFHRKRQTKACIFFKHELALNIIKTLLSDCLRLAESMFIQLK